MPEAVVDNAIGGNETMSKLLTDRFNQSAKGEKIPQLIPLPGDYQHQAAADRQNDDERVRAARGLITALNEVFEELTGCGIRDSDAENLTEIGEILASELRSHYSLAKNISKPSAFLAQHLRSLCSSEPIAAPMRRNYNHRQGNVK